MSCRCCGSASCEHSGTDAPKKKKSCKRKGQQWDAPREEQSLTTEAMILSTKIVTSFAPVVESNTTASVSVEKIFKSSSTESKESTADVVNQQIKQWGTDGAKNKKSRAKKKGQQQEQQGTIVSVAGLSMALDSKSQQTTLKKPTKEMEMVVQTSGSGEVMKNLKAKPEVPQIPIPKR